MGDATSGGTKKYTPVLGLMDDAVPLQRPAQVPQPEADAEPRPAGGGIELSVIVPARNEELRLPECLQSLLAQDDSGFPLGTEWELLLVDDASTDATRQVMEDAAAGRTGVSVLCAPPLDPAAFTGKSHACWFAARQARGRWLLFTDADTVHEPRDLLHALYEARKHEVKLLSYSPRQVLSGFWQHAVMPLVFSELASVYKMSDVNDPVKRTAAANGQFLMVERETYFAIGGHRVVGRSVLEDVDLAWNVKRATTRGAGRGIRFRYAPDAVSTRMYAGLGDMVEGWSKNLARLFPHALQLAAWRLLDVVLWLLPLLLLAMPWLIFCQKMAILLLWGRTMMRFYRRVSRAHFPWYDTAVSPLGLPLFLFLLVRSWMLHHVTHRVRWKGREYRTGS